MATTFTAQVEGWVTETEGALLAIVRTSTQEMVALIKKPIGQGGNMPIDTSFLQNSLVGSATAMPSIDPAHTGGAPNAGNEASVQALIAGMELGTTLHFGFTAVYALRQNYGFQGADSLGRVYNQSGRHFVELAVQQWQQIVTDTTRRLAGRLAFGG